MEPTTLLPVVQEMLDQQHITYKVLPCDESLADTAAFCEHYGFTLDQSANTIVIASRKVEPTQYAVCVVLATTRLDVNKKVSELMGVKKVSFADAETTAMLTGMQIGGVTAIGLPDLPIYIDAAVMNQKEVVMGGGNRTSKLLLSPQELTKLPRVHIIENLANPKPQD